MGNLYKEIYVTLEKIDLLKNFIKDCNKVDDDDLSLLIELFKRKIHHFLVFDLLLRVNKKKLAYSLLIDFYLSEDVNLFNNIKDHASDLEMLFDTIVEIDGEIALSELLNSEAISIANLKHESVKKSLIFALDLEDELPSWFLKLIT
jgi:hypothetical protein